MTTINSSLKRVDDCVTNTCSPGGTHLDNCPKAAGSVMSVERIPDKQCQAIRPADKRQCQLVAGHEGQHIAKYRTPVLDSKVTIPAVARWSTAKPKQYEAYAVWAAANLDGTPVQALCIEAREGDEHPFYFSVASTGARLVIEQAPGGWKIELAVPSNGLEASTESRLVPFEPSEYTLCAHGFREVAR